MAIDRTRTPRRAPRRAELDFDAGPEPAEVVTPAGPLQLRPTGRDHICVSTVRRYRNVPADPPGATFTIRGVEYIGSAHAYRWRDGSWHIGPEQTDDSPTALAAFHSSRWLSLSLSRLDDRDTSGPARATATALLEDAVRDWAPRHARDLDRAEVTYCHNELRHATSEYNRGAEALDEQIDRLAERYDAHQRALEHSSVWTDADSTGPEDLEAAAAMVDRIRAANASAAALHATGAFLNHRAWWLPPRRRSLTEAPTASGPPEAHASQ